MACNFYNILTCTKSLDAQPSENRMCVSMVVQVYNIASTRSDKYMNPLVDGVVS